MAITLITGLPGAGKTTFLIDTVEKKRYHEKQKRAVYYYNINELKTDWVKLNEPAEWMELPQGAIIVIDECQDVFPQTKIGEPKPEYYKMLAKHRHGGKDIYLVTQDPGLIDAFVRKLCEHHYHLKRRFGLNGSTLFTGAQGGVFDVRKELYRQYKSAYKFPKKVQQLYHSAEIHTVKKSFPVKLLVFPIAIIGVVVGGIWFFNFIDTMGDDPNTIASQLNPEQQPTEGMQQRLAIPSRQANFISIGALAGSQVYFLGKLNERLLVEVNGSVLQGRSLKRLGYNVVYIDECLITISLNAVTCKPEKTPEKTENIEGGGGAHIAERAPSAPRKPKNNNISEYRVDRGQYILPGISENLKTNTEEGYNGLTSAKYNLRTIN